MKTLIKFVLGISTVLFFAFCLTTAPIQKKVVEIFTQKELSDEEFNVEEFFGETEQTSGTEESYNTNTEDQKVEKKFHSPEAVDYFNEITLGSETGSGRSTPYKWTENVKIFVEGSKPSYLMDELDRVVGELNSIINTINIQVVSNRREANLVVFLGSKSQFLSAHPEITDLPRCLGYFLTFTNESTVFVDINRTQGEIEFQKHILREEVTQSLGLFNDSEKYTNSIFYDGYSVVTEYSEIDKELIDMLYNE